MNLAPQPLDVNLDEIGERVEGLVPNVLGNVGAGHHFFRAAGQMVLPSPIVARLPEPLPKWQR